VAAGYGVSHTVPLVAVQQAQNVRIWMLRVLIHHLLAHVHIGGYRAVAAASDHNPARPAFQSVCEPNAD
jgi:hypothetical protein